MYAALPAGNRCRSGEDPGSPYQSAATAATRTILVYVIASLAAIGRENRG